MRRVFPGKNQGYTPFNSLERNQFLYTPSRNQIPFTRLKAHGNWIFVDPALAPNFNLVEIFSCLSELRCYGGWDTLSQIERALAQVASGYLIDGQRANGKKRRPYAPIVVRDFRIWNRSRVSSGHHRFGVFQPIIFNKHIYSSWFYFVCRDGCKFDAFVMAQ